MRNIVYRISKSFFITSDMVRHIESKMMMLCPENKKEIQKKVGEQLIKTYVLCILSIVFLFKFADVSVYYSIVVAMTLYAVVDSSMHNSINKLEVELLSDFLSFIENVKFKFQFDGMIEEALLDAINDSNAGISVHGQIIYNHLKESYAKDRCDYQDVCPNHFFLTFYSLCESVVKYGDKKLKDGSLFIKSIGCLKEDISIYILKQKAIENAFMGLSWICILPIYFLKPMEIWAVSNMPELSAYYNGSLGKMSVVLLAVMSLGVYKIVMNLKYPKVGQGIKKRWVIKLSKQEFVKKCITGYMNVFVNEMRELDKLLRTIVYPYNIVEFCVMRIVMSVCIGILAFVMGVSVGIGSMSILLGFAGCVITYFGQVVNVRIKKNILLMEREDEVIRFQGIILMLMYSDKITVEQILNQLERFAISFKKQIEEMVDKLSYKGTAVFKEIKNKSDFLPFNRLIDGFIACDDMYIYKAFEDVEMDRRYYIEKHKQEKIFYIEQRGAISKFLSFVPLCSAILINLIIPFVMEGIQQLNLSNMNV